MKTEAIGVHQSDTKMAAAKNSFFSYRGWRKQGTEEAHKMHLAAHLYLHWYVMPYLLKCKTLLVFWVQADWPRKMSLIFLACSRPCQLECLQLHYSQHQQILFKGKMFVTIVTIQSWDRKHSCNLTCLTAAFLLLFSSPNPIPLRDRVSSQTDKKTKWKSTKNDFDIKITKKEQYSIHICTKE